MKIPCNWRSTIVGSLLVAFGAIRVWRRPESLFEAETTGYIVGGLYLILGSDRLLGFMHPPPAPSTPEIEKP